MDLETHAAWDWKSSGIMTFGTVSWTISFVLQENDCLAYRGMDKRCKCFIMC